MTPKPILRFWQLWNMSFGYVGIQFGFALQNANVSRIFETLGAKVDEIPILWIAGPVTGLVVQPIIGYLSDRTWNRLGRRKPYFLGGAICASLALLVMPNSPALWFAAGMLWILDAAINVTMEPMRAFVGDMLPDEQRTTGFAMQTFFIGASSVVGSLLPYMLTNWFGVANTAAAGLLPDSVKWSFYLGGVVFFGAVLWTILRVKEYSPEQQRAFHGETKETAAAEEVITLDAGQATRGGFLWLFVGLVLTAFIYGLKWDKGLYILSVGATGYGLLQLVAAWAHRTGGLRGLVGLMHDLGNMPLQMKRLAWAQMLTWFALFAFFIYATSAVTSHHFGSSDPRSQAYNDGADWVGVLMAVWNGVAALVAFALPVLARRAGRVLTHVGCLVVGGIGLGSMYFFRDPQLLLISMVGMGIAWASLLTLPYAILSSVVPYRKMGVYMGMFNFFIVIPQIVAAAVLGLLVRTVFDGHAVNALLLGGVAMVAAAVAMLRVQDTPGPRNS
ncbi:MAG: maltose/moltooligosaccharide transporter [Verrucomicrobiota bacterium]|nr:maltose/moltooligosaccharide transporter [Verrucomicrobiota bacterium]